MSFRRTIALFALFFTAGVAIPNGAQAAPACSGNACNVVKLKVLQGTKAKIRNTSDDDVKVTIVWANVLGQGKTKHTLWGGEQETVQGPAQYLGVHRYEAVFE